jgi:NAD-dependent dihydropyrimidine dehydrogenase PreA subunit
MPYVIAEPCSTCKDHGCVQACPVDVIHPTPDEPGYQRAVQLYIDPVGCIDCGACVPECPVEAIFRDTDLPEKWLDYKERNRDHYESPTNGAAA